MSIEMAIGTQEGGTAMPQVAIDFLRAWEEAHKAAVTEPVREKAAYLLHSVGPRIGAAAIGLSDARQLKRWAAEDGREPREHDVAARLDALYWIVRAVTECYSAGVASRFLRSANPQLDDEAPLVVLGSAEDSEAVRRVLVSARAFLEG
jgi:O-acetyl-ADP-ribose deacetylase (regulator of RNase III)